VLRRVRLNGASGRSGTTLATARRELCLTVRDMLPSWIAHDGTFKHLLEVCGVATAPPREAAHDGADTTAWLMSEHLHPPSRALLFVGEYGRGVHGRAAKLQVARPACAGHSWRLKCWQRTCDTLHCRKQRVWVGAADSRQDEREQVRRWRVARVIQAGGSAVAASVNTRASAMADRQPQTQ
jgi:hypothetical protein